MDIKSLLTDWKSILIILIMAGTIYFIYNFCRRTNESIAILEQGQEELKKQQEAQKQAFLRSILSDKAKQRLTNIRLVKPQLAENIENQLIYLSQSGRVIGRVSEEQLLNLLKKLQDRKRDSSITFKRV